MNSYKKLKKKNQELLMDMRVLVEDNNYMAIQRITALYRAMFGMADHVMYGSHNIYPPDIDLELMDHIVADKPTGLSVFKTIINNGEIRKAAKLHKLEIYRSIIFGKYCTAIGASDGIELYMWSGFLERYGRMPTKEDKIVLIKGKYYDYINSGSIWSELGWMLVKQKT
jgi:hypothetical protein